MTTFPAGRRSRAALVHLGVSGAVAALVGLLCFRLWFPPPYAEIAGGAQLFVLLVGVDVVMGPLLTAVVAAPGKPRRELVRDIAVIAVLQLAAFGYGLHILAGARPVWLSFEIDRLRVVSAAEIDTEHLGEAPAGLQQLSWTGPRPLAAVKPTDPQELLRSIDLGLAGFDLSMQPRYWRDYAAYRDEAWRRARPLAVLAAHEPGIDAALRAAAAGAQVDEASMRFLPLVSRHAHGVALLAAPDARFVGFVAADGFF